MELHRTCFRLEKEAAELMLAPLARAYRTLAKSRENQSLCSRINSLECVLAKVIIQQALNYFFIPHMMNRNPVDIRIH
jgi:hypothetical protein